MRTAKAFQSETEDECIIKGLERMSAADYNTTCECIEECACVKMSDCVSIFNGKLVEINVLV